MYDWPEDNQVHGVLVSVVVFLQADAYHSVEILQGAHLNIVECLWSRPYHTILIYK